MEDLFGCLTCVIADEGKDKFIVGEGIELAQIMLGGGKLSKQRSLRVLYCALFGQSGVAAGERLIDTGG